MLLFDLPYVPEWLWEMMTIAKKTAFKRWWHQYLANNHLSLVRGRIAIQAWHIVQNFRTNNIKRLWKLLNRWKLNCIQKKKWFSTSGFIPTKWGGVAREKRELKMQMCTTPEYFHVSTYFLSFDKTVNGNGGYLIPIAKENVQCNTKCGCER